MNTTLKFIIVTLLMGCYYYCNAQTVEWKEYPKPEEKKIGEVSSCLSAGKFAAYDEEGKRMLEDDRKTYSEKEMYDILYEQALNKYSEDYPNFKLRKFSYNTESNHIQTVGHVEYGLYGVYNWYYYFSAWVVVPDSRNLSFSYSDSCLTRALGSIHKGARIAISKCSVCCGIDEDNYKDIIIELLLDKGYRVVAKEYMQNLYEEQKQQQSGVYNDTTTVMGNNFSAAGYYINIKISDKSIRVQLVNVSTGEYEGNATVNF